MMFPSVKKLVPAAVLIAAVALPVSAATVKGTVKYEGKVPKSALRPIRMEADPGCAKKHSSPAMPEFLVLGDGNTLANIFVQVKSGLSDKTYPVPDTPVELNQQGCQYKPHVMGVRVGQTFRVINSDGLLHNVHSLPKVNRPFNKAMPANVKKADYTFEKPEPTFKVKCDVHPWMGAWITVMDHPYFDVTGIDGSYEIKDLPAGTYEIEIWHEKLGTQTESVTVADGDTQSLDFSLSPPKR